MPISSGKNRSKKSITTWKVNYLLEETVSDTTQVLSSFANPWGMMIYDNYIVCNVGAHDGIIRLDKLGNIIGNAVGVRDWEQNSSYPTGITANLTSLFRIIREKDSRPSRILICTEHGTVIGYNPDMDETSGYILINTKPIGLVDAFRGLTVAANRLYLANFSQGRIDVYDGQFNKLPGYYFVDNDQNDPLPPDYAPNNIVEIDDLLYVMYAKRKPGIIIAVEQGPGNGYISVFNLEGTWLRRFSSRGVLDTPWAFIRAPYECGIPVGSYLAGNTGDGRINIFDCTGKYVGPMLNQSGEPIAIEGLRALVPYYTSFNQIFFTSSVTDSDGTMGTIIKDQIVYY